MIKAYITSNVKTTLKRELVSSHLKVKDLLHDKMINSNDLIITESGREFLYNSVFKNVITLEEFQKKDIKAEVIDLSRQAYKIDYPISSEKKKLYQSFKKSDIKFDDNFVCLSFRNSTKQTNLNSNAQWFKNLISRLRETYQKVYITGRGAHQFEADGAINVNLQEWCTLISSTNCKLIISTMNGACQAARIFSNAKKLIEIDLEDSDWELEKNNLELLGFNPKLIETEIIRKQSHVSYEHLIKILNVTSIPRNEKYLVIGVVNSALRTGLGDNLVYSVIPRLAKEQGYKKVYLSSTNNPRSEAIQNLVWKDNPYIDGKVSEKSFTETTLEGVMSTRNYLYDSSTNLIEMISDAYKLDRNESLSPEIYYQPKIISEMKKKVLWDPNYVTSSHGITLEMILQWLKDNNIEIDYQFKALGTTSIVLPNGICKKTIECKDLFEYTDYLNSCKTCIMLLSGGSILSAAIKKRSVVLHSKSPDVGNRKWMFKPNEYVYLP